jgi:hypothetical protein
VGFYGAFLGSFLASVFHLVNASFPPYSDLSNDLSIDPPRFISVISIFNSFKRDAFMLLASR